MAVWIKSAGKTNPRREGGLFNAVGLTVTSSVKKTADLILEIEPQRAPGHEASFCCGQAA